MGIDVPDVLTNEIGPLPVWGWAVAGVAGISLGRLARGKSGSASSSTSDVGSSIGSTGSAVTLPQGYVSRPVAGTSEGFESNTEWMSTAVGYLVGEGYDPLTAQSALSDYINGRPLTSDAEHPINDVLGSLGLPPRPPNQIARTAPEPVAVNEPAQDIYANDQLARIVREAYRENLGREPDAEGMAFWRGQLASGAIQPKDLDAQFEAAAAKELGTLTNQ